MALKLVSRPVQSHIINRYIPKKHKSGELIGSLTALILSALTFISSQKTNIISHNITKYLQKSRINSTFVTQTKIK